jgi:arylsulfatase
VHEGGIATPLIVHWPAGVKAKGELRHSAGHVIDMVPTVLEVAGVERQTVEDEPQIPLAPGRSLVTWFAYDGTAPSSRWLWWCHEGHRAVRIGDWKLVAAKGDPWELYNLTTDRSERANVAGQRPDLAERLESFWTDRWKEFQAQAAVGVDVREEGSR